MIVNGPLTLGSTLHMGQTAGGLPQLLLHAFDAGIGPNGIAYKLIWTGQTAKAFYAANEARLKIGAQLNVIAINPQPLCMDGQVYGLASVLDIQVGAAKTPAPSPNWKARHEAATV